MEYHWTATSHKIRWARVAADVNSIREKGGASAFVLPLPLSCVSACHAFGVFGALT